MIASKLHEEFIDGFRGGAFLHQWCYFIQRLSRKVARFTHGLKVFRRMEFCARRSFSFRHSGILSGDWGKVNLILYGYEKESLCLTLPRLAYC